MSKNLKSKIKYDVSLANYNTFKIGGKAKAFVQVDTKEELKDAILFAKQNNMPYYILGGGTNILVSDDGFSGIVIKNNISDIKINEKECYMIAGSGISVGALLNQAKKLGFSGLEWACGLPGTLGGAIFGNAGSCGGCIADLVEFVDVLDPETLKFKYILKDQCEFKYRDSAFKRNGLLITSAMLSFKKDDPVNIMNKMAENFAFRRGHQPLSEKTEGCIFKNIDLKEKKDFPKIWNDIFEFSVFVKKKMVPAGFLIDRAGLKGLSCGGAKVSQRHANFILTEKGATAKDVFDLILKIKSKVKEKFSVELEEEIQFLGF